VQRVVVVGMVLAGARVEICHSGAIIAASRGSVNLRRLRC
jgi:hypothetical protein